MGRTEPSPGGSKELQFFLVFLSPTQCVKTQISSVIIIIFQASPRPPLHQLHLTGRACTKHLPHPTFLFPKLKKHKPNQTQFSSPKSHHTHSTVPFPQPHHHHTLFPNPTHPLTHHTNVSNPHQKSKTKSRYRTSHLRTPPPQSSPHAPSSSKATH